jgi:hypothetical protein
MTSSFLKLHLELEQACIDDDLEKAHSIPLEFLEEVSNIEGLLITNARRYPYPATVFQWLLENYVDRIPEPSMFFRRLCFIANEDLIHYWLAAANADHSLIMSKRQRVEDRMVLDSIKCMSISALRAVKESFESSRVTSYSIIDIEELAQQCADRNERGVRDLVHYLHHTVLDSSIHDAFWTHVIFEVFDEDPIELFDPEEDAMSWIVEHALSKDRKQELAEFFLASAPSINRHADPESCSFSASASSRVRV